MENSLDACDLAGVLPDIDVRLMPLSDDANDVDPKAYVLRVQDNGPGVDPKYVPNAFGRVFFGSKFLLRQSRGMFGLGGTMAILYGQITTNKPVSITTSSDGSTAYAFDLMINIQENTPLVISKKLLPAKGYTGTMVELTLEGDYSRASQKILDYFRQTALVTPYATILLRDPFGRPAYFERATTSMPHPPVETLPHPYGIDVEAIRRLLKQSKDPTLLKFMVNNFHRVGERIARKFLEYVGLDAALSPKEISNEQTVFFVDALHRFPEFLQPDADCLSPLGEEILMAGITKELQPEFAAVVQRPPSAYSGFPFIVEVGLAFGGQINSPGTKLYRFANRIPLLYDEANDVAWKVLNEEIDWRRYHIPQDAPLAIITHVCSTRVPYKTVGKEYLADRPELERELKNAVREVLRRLGVYLSRKGSMEMVRRKMNIYGKYIPLISKFSTDLAGAKRPPRYRSLLGQTEVEEEKIEEQKILEEFT